TCPTATRHGAQPSRAGRALFPRHGRRQPRLRLGPGRPRPGQRAPRRRHDRSTDGTGAEEHRDHPRSGWHDAAARHPLRRLHRRHEGVPADERGLRARLRRAPSRADDGRGVGAAWRGAARGDRCRGRASAEMRTIEEPALRTVITPQVAVDAMREAFRADGEGRAHVPAVINLDVRKHHGEFHVKTALIEAVPHVAVKIASGFYDNPAKGLPSGSGLMAVFDATTGMPVALLLDNGFLTDIRTG